MKAIIIAVLLLIQGCASLPKVEQTQESRMKYNYQENEWEYTAPGSSLRYNIYENKWEWSK